MNCGPRWSAARLSIASDRHISCFALGAGRHVLDLATDFENRFYRAFEHLARLPYSGHSREDLTARPVRFWGVSQYLIVYRPETKPLEVLRILHGKRDLRRLLA